MGLAATFAKAIKYYRESAGLSQEALAEQAQLDRTFVSQLERGLKSPTLTSLEKLAACLGVDPQRLLNEPPTASSTRFPKDYFIRDIDSIDIVRSGKRIPIPAGLLTSAINVTHELVDDLYAGQLDVAGILGMRNLSALIGELVAAAVLKCARGRFEKNPHQDGYPDLLLMDEYGRREWRLLEDRLNEKAPFSRFAGGGIEVKATCGSVPTPRKCRARRVARPSIGDTRIACLEGYDWKAHHRETNNLVGVLWDFVARRPRVTAMFYSSELEGNDWGRIVRPRDGGGRATGVSIMNRSGIRETYVG